MGTVGGGGPPMDGRGESLVADPDFRRLVRRGGRRRHGGRPWRVGACGGVARGCWKRPLRGARAADTGGGAGPRGVRGGDGPPGASHGGDAGRGGGTRAGGAGGAGLVCERRVHRRSRGDSEGPANAAPKAAAHLGGTGGGTIGAGPARIARTGTGGRARGDRGVHRLPLRVLPGPVAGLDRSGGGLSRPGAAGVQEPAAARGRGGVAFPPGGPGGVGRGPLLGRVRAARRACGHAHGPPVGRTGPIHGHGPGTVAGVDAAAPAPGPDSGGPC